MANDKKTKTIDDYFPGASTLRELVRPFHEMKSTLDVAKDWYANEEKHRIKVKKLPIRKNPDIEFLKEAVQYLIDGQNAIMACLVEKGIFIPKKENN